MGKVLHCWVLALNLATRCGTPSIKVLTKSDGLGPGPFMCSSSGVS